MLQCMHTFIVDDLYQYPAVMIQYDCWCTEEEVPSYQLPYKEEAGSRPTLERLKDIVAIKKLRPSLPTIWGNHEVRQCISCVAVN